MKLLNWSCQKIHCSVDDTLWIFKDLTEHKEYVSIFENPILNKIKELHLKFGAVFTCYCFFNAWYNFTLADATDRFTKEFEKNLKKMQTGLNLDFMDMVLMNQRLTGRMKLLIALN